jgi:hypothetical protein
MKRWIIVCLFMMIAYGSSGALTWADDLYQPTWQRGTANTTYQDWTFNSNANPVAPDLGLFNPNGSPLATISGGATWFQFFDNHAGVWVLDPNSSMDLFIPNTPADETRYKDVHTQVTWEPNVTGLSAPVVMVNGIASSPVFTVPVGNGGWMQSVYDTRLAFNPSSEDVIITGSYHLGQVVIDTQCVPEPSTIALLSMGILGLLAVGWRQRRQS